MTESHITFSSYLLPTTYELASIRGFTCTTMTLAAIPSEGLPEDVLVASFLQLPGEDILKMRHVRVDMHSFTTKVDGSEFRCTLKRISGIKQLWAAIWNQDILADRLLTPAYTLPLDFLSSSQCKSLATHSMNLSRLLTDGGHDCTPAVITLHQPRSVTWVQLIRGQWLLVASSDQSSSKLSLWHLLSMHTSNGPGNPVSEAFLDGPVAGGFVDLQDEIITCALEIRAAL